MNPATQQEVEFGSFKITTFKSEIIILFLWKITMNKNFYLSSACMKDK